MLQIRFPYSYDVSVIEVSVVSNKKTGMEWAYG